MGFFKKHKENRELNVQDREARREHAAAANEVKQQWLDKANELRTRYDGAIRAAGSVDLEAMQQAAQRVQRIAARGVPGTATVTSAREIGPGMAGVGVRLELELDLISGPGSPRRLTIRQDVMGSADAYPPGLELPLKIDSDDHDDAMIWADPLAAGAATAGRSAQTAGTDHAAHLEAIAQLRDRGALTEEQFQLAKARLLAAE